MPSPPDDRHRVRNAAPRARRGLVVAERAAWLIGTARVVAFGAVELDRGLGARADVTRFMAVQAQEPFTAAAPNLTLWEPKRIAAWRKALETPGPPAIAVLRIRTLGIEVPVLPGTDDVTLDRAVGHIEDTALPGTDGNSGIAGHRDGFFRGIKDIAIDDAIEIETRHGKEVYRVQRTWVVSPDDTSVLDATPTPSLTLVTCYPFYYVGPAPQRFIVRAERVADATPSSASR